MPVLLILTAALVGAAVYFAASAVGYRRHYQRMTRLQRDFAQAAEEARRPVRERRPGGVLGWPRYGAKIASGHIESRLRAVGWPGDVVTPIAGAVVLYASVVAVGVRLTSLPPVLIAVAAAAAAVVAPVYVQRRRRASAARRFTEQLGAALQQIANQIEAGSGPETAFADVSVRLVGTIRTEFDTVRDRVASGASYSECLEDVATRHPSQAMNLFVAAMSAKDREGQLVPILREGAAIIRREQQLAAESMARISQARAEFYASSLLVAFISLIVGSSLDQTGRDAFFSPGGLALLAICAAWVAVGFFRAHNIIARAKGEK